METKLRAENSTLRNRIQILEKSLDVLKSRKELKEKGLLTDRRYDRKANHSTIDVVEDRADKATANNSSVLVEENDKNYRGSKEANPRMNQSLQARHIVPPSDIQTLQTFSWGKPVDRKWTDAKVFKENREARITGLVVWHTDVIVGLRFSYRAHSKTIFTDEHVILRSKDYHKNMFEFTGDDYLQNLVLYEQDGKLVGMTMFSRDNKQFEVGKLSGKSVDLGIKPPLVPVYSFGSLGSIIDINKIERYSVVASLGLQTISL